MVAKSKTSKAAKSSKKIIGIDEFAEQFAVTMCSELSTLLDNEVDHLGLDVRDAVVYKFVEAFLGSHLLKTMLRQSNQESVEEAQSAFSSVKLNMSCAIGDAFSGALSAWSGRRAEYYCKISLMPPMLSDKVS